MDIRKTALFILAISIFACAQTASAQACGGSTYTWTVFVRNGTHAKDVSYRIYPVRRKNDDFDVAFHKYLTDTFTLGSTERFLYFLGPMYKAFRLDRSIVEKFIAGYAPSQYEEFRGEKALGKNSLTGKVVDGVVNFYTSETDSTPYLVEITAKGFYPEYYFGHPFGGCRRFEDIILREGPKI